ncbi:MAG: NAD-dependent epimerase/dehydratase family protein [Thermomicrobiales bacterium]
MSTNHITGLHVIFGTGPLGMATMRELVRRGRRVRMVNRSGRAAVPESVAVVRGDAYDEASTRAVCAGAAVVYQCAQPAYTAWARQFPALQAGVLAGAEAVGAKLVVAENLYMYGKVERPMTETMPHAATTRKGRVRAAMSEALLVAHRAGRVRVAIGRGSDFYGPGVRDSSLGERVFFPALAGKGASAIGDLDQPHTYTFIDDFGTALVNLGERDEALGRAWHVPNAPTLTTREVIATIYRQLGQPPKMSGMGRLMLMLGGIAIPEARETIEMLYEFQHPFVVDHRDYARLFGEHATPLEEGLRQTIAWYRDEARREGKAVRTAA